jgi:CubicO group peptidase (beta-lactamase class C family)
MSAMPRRRRWRRWLAAAAVILLLALGGLAALIVSEWTYLKRLHHYSQGLPTPVEWFVPKEPVAGAPAPLELPSIGAGEAGLRPEAVAAAAEAALGKNASAFLVLRDGKVVEERYAPGRRREDWTDSASMMKTVTALLIGIAVAEGRIRSVDEPASTYLNEWAGDGRRAITVRHLLQMRSGLRPEGEYEDPFSDACYLALGTDLDSIVRNIPLVDEPGARFDYNNANFQALGLLLERATGRRFADYLSEELWKPLGNGPAAVWLDRAGGRARTFGFLFAAARDWARVGLLILNRGRAGERQVLGEEWIRFMSSPSPPEATYGAGLYLGPDDPEDPPFAAPDTVVLNGRHKQRVYVVPSRGLVIVRVGPQVKVKGWNDSFLPNLLVQELEGPGPAAGAPGSGAPR